MDMARSLGHVDGGQEEALEALCRAAQAELAGRLRPEVRSEDCEDAFILACAWLALAGLAAGETGGGRFTAGEVTTIWGQPGMSTLKGSKIVIVEEEQC